MKFDKILEYLKQGKKVRREKWDNDGYSIQANGSISFGGGYLHPFTIEDFEANDWVVFQEKEDLLERVKSAIKNIGDNYDDNYNLLNDLQKYLEQK